MLAAVLQCPQRVVVSEVPDRLPAAGEVRVRLDGAGICASELPLWEGRDWFDYPRAPGEPGHEGWGTVEALGSGASGLQLGSRVALISERAHAEHDVVPADRVVALPDELARNGPFPGEPLACAVNAMRRAGVENGHRVAVIGCGFLGLLLVQLCVAVTDEVVAISRRSSALEHALAAGARSAWQIDDRQLAQLAEFDVVLEVTGHQRPLDLAGRLTRVRGRLVIAGYHQDGRREVDMGLWNWRGLDVINAHERDPDVYVRGLREAIDAVRCGRLDPQPLLTHRFAFEELGEAYRVASRRPEGFIKAVWCRA